MEELDGERRKRVRRRLIPPVLVGLELLGLLMQPGYPQDLFFFHASEHADGERRGTRGRPEGYPYRRVSPRDPSDVTVRFDLAPRRWPSACAERVVKNGSGHPQDLPGRAGCWPTGPTARLRKGRTLSRRRSLKSFGGSRRRRMPSRLSRRSSTMPLNVSSGSSPIPSAELSFV